jgi:hypothetical protein
VAGPPTGAAPSPAKGAVRAAAGGALHRHAGAGLRCQASCRADPMGSAARARRPRPAAPAAGGRATGPPFPARERPARGRRKVGRLPRRAALPRRRSPPGVRRRSPPWVRRRSPPGVRRRKRAARRLRTVRRRARPARSPRRRSRRYRAPALPVGRPAGRPAGGWPASAVPARLPCSHRPGRPPGSRRGRWAGTGCSARLRQPHRSRPGRGHRASSPRPAPCGLWVSGQPLGSANPLGSYTLSRPPITERTHGLGPSATWD